MKIINIIEFLLFNLKNIIINKMLGYNKFRSLEINLFLIFIVEF
ncbi:hypothetical protein HMPREF1564_2903 [Providencia alcalifaciens R90-1475]|nr:hypothetical protein HMPREF1564_2903 [Providencia alcalifaciens R90-1475]